jgi:hypothetical protein
MSHACCPTHYVQVLLNGEAMEPFTAFTACLAKDPFITSSPVGIIADHLYTILSAPTMMPSEVTAAVDHLVTTAKATPGSGDVATGLANVFTSIAQGRTLLRLARAVADKRARELSYLNELTATVQTVTSLSADTPALQPSVEALVRGSAALCQAVPKASSEAAREYCATARAIFGRLLKKVVHLHVTSELAVWLPTAISAHGSTSRSVELPGWSVTQLQSVVAHKLTHTIDLGHLPAILNLLVELKGISSVCDKVATDTLDAVEAVIALESWTQCSTSCVAMRVQCDATIGDAFNKITGILSSLSSDKTNRALDAH